MESTRDSCPIKVGQIVTVLDRDSMEFDKQGEVVAVNGRVSVKFPRQGRDFTVDLQGGYDRDARHEEKVLEFDPALLCVDEAGWTMENEARQVFAGGFGGFWQVMVPTFDLNPEAKCMRKHCTQHSTHKTFINFVGSVYVFYTCKACRERWNGTVTEGDLPFIYEKAIKES